MRSASSPPTCSRGSTSQGPDAGGPGGVYNTYDIGTGKVISLDAADPSVDLDYDGYGGASFSGRIGAARFANLGELRAMTTEKHAVELTVAAFATPPTIPASPFPAQSPPDLRPAAGGAAIDVGIALPGFAYAGAAPDLGAYEAGAPFPVYGPR